MQDYTYLMTRPLDWQRNKAVNLPALLNAKQAWFDKYHHKFWSDWKKDIFDLTTANSFGLLVWSIILDVPAQAFVLFPGDIFWAFGDLRQNYWHVDIPGGQSEGGNFLGGSQGAILTTEEARKALRMKYYALTLAGTVPQINRALLGVFGVDDTGLANAYVIDNHDMTMTYYHKDDWSSNFVVAVETFDLLPKVAGVKYNIVEL